ncbi:MAG: hypothetical protein FWH51_06265 [Dehalococcoidia bacterium]|nr:hypothetical protein [Dehalococcoidia bacterium]
MKVLLIILAIAVVLGGVGCGVWLIMQKSDELNQARAANTSLNADLATARNQLTTAQSSAADAQIQLDDAKNRAEALQSDLDTAQARVVALEAELKAINDLVDGSQSDITSEINRISAELAKANTDLAEAQAARDEALAEYKKISEPRHFYSVEELKAWLLLDDTDTNPDYTSLGLADKAFILQVRALRDGYLLPAAIDADTEHIYSWNTAIIGASIYIVIAGTDEVSWLANFEVPPAQRPLSP